MMLAGASWAILCTVFLFHRWILRLGVLGAAGAVVLGQALTAGRAGYAAWAGVGFLLSLLRWRVALVLVPVVGLGIASWLPGVQERISTGFGDESGIVVVQSDDYEMTAGRSAVWPLVADKILEAPLFGHGRLAMRRTGLTHYIRNELRDIFGHPHNAYLELLLDSGVLGVLLAAPFFIVMVMHALTVFLDRNDPMFCAAGGAALSLMTALFIAGMGAQTFYPREGVVGMWAMLGVLLRVSVERRNALAERNGTFVLNEESEPFDDSDEIGARTLPSRERLMIE
jgi:O-antigen ligase